MFAPSSGVCMISGLNQNDCWGEFHMQVVKASGHSNDVPEYSVYCSSCYLHITPNEGRKELHDLLKRL